MLLDTPAAIRVRLHAAGKVFRWNLKTESVSVPQAESRTIWRAWRARRRGTSELGAQRGDGMSVTRHSAPLGARHLLHGVDQRRQPQALGACRSPSLNLLTHASPHDSLTVRYNWQLGKRQLVPFQSPTSLRQRKSRAM